MRRAPRAGRGHQALRLGCERAEDECRQEHRGRHREPRPPAPRDPRDRARDRGRERAEAEEQSVVEEDVRHRHDACRGVRAEARHRPPHAHRRRERRGERHEPEQAQRGPHQRVRRPQPRHPPRDGDRGDERRRHPAEEPEEPQVAQEREDHPADDRRQPRDPLEDVPRRAPVGRPRDRDPRHGQHRRAGQGERKRDALHAVAHEPAHAPVPQQRHREVPAQQEEELHAEAVDRRHRDDRAAARLGVLHRPADLRERHRRVQCDAEQHREGPERVQVVQPLVRGVRHIGLSATVRSYISRSFALSKIISWRLRPVTS